MVPIHVYEEHPENFRKPVCERHEDEVVNKACKQCDKLICPECDRYADECIGKLTTQCTLFIILYYLLFSTIYYFTLFIILHYSLFYIIYYFTQFIILHYLSVLIIDLFVGSLLGCYVLN